MTGSSDYTEFNFLPDILNEVMVNIYVQKTNSIQQEVSLINTINIRCDVVGFSSDSDGALMLCTETIFAMIDANMDPEFVQSGFDSCVGILEDFSRMCRIGGTIRQENTLEMVTTLEDNFEFSFEILQDMVSEFDVEFDKTTDAIADMVDAFLGGTSETITTVAPKLKNSLSTETTIEVMNKIHTNVMLRNKVVIEHVGIEGGAIIEQKNVANIVTSILTEHSIVMKVVQEMDTALDFSFRSYVTGFADYIEAIGNMIGGILTGKIGMAVAIPLLGVVMTVVVFTALRGGGGGKPVKSVPNAQQAASSAAQAAMTAAGSSGGSVSAASSAAQAAMTAAGSSGGSVSAK